MIKKITYQTNDSIEYDAEGELSIKTGIFFKAILVFGQEVAPKDKEKVHSRFRTRYSNNPYREILSSYLSKRELMGVLNQGLFGLDFVGYRGQNKLDFFAAEHFFGMGLTLSARSKNKIPLDEIINLDALNQYILTGEYSGRRNDDGIWVPNQTIQIPQTSPQLA